MGKYQEESDGEYLYKTSCEHCGSSDANAIYSSGTSYCFSCGIWDRNDDSTGVRPVRENVMSRDVLLKGDYRQLKARKITEKTTGKYKYSITEDKDGNPCQVANYYNKDKELVAQKVRYQDKKFRFIGHPKEALLFGQQLWGSGGKKLTITEGEIDALSVAEAFDCKYPVVSIPNGAQGARRELSKHLDWIDSFEEVYLWFDNDEPGRKAVEDCLTLLPAGKVKIISHDEWKDASDVLINEGKAGIVQTFYNAQVYRPDGILSVQDLMEEVSKPLQIGTPWVFKGLTDATYGRRLGEIYGFGAGVGIGKTDMFTQQISYDIFELNKKVGLFFLEQSPAETLRRVSGKVDGRAYHIPESGWTQEELNSTLEKIMSNGNLYLYNNFGSTDWDVVSSRIRYMAHNLEVEHIYLDHLTALASHASDERRFLDGLMEQLASLAQELNIIIHFVSHLTTPASGSHEEGARVEAKHFRGSRSIMQWSHGMFGLERNNQHPDIDERQKTIIRILKERYTGQGVGKTVPLKYNTDKFMLEETDEDFDEVPMLDEEMDY